MQSTPKQLQSLVYWAIGILGESIKRQYGTQAYNLIEKSRASMKNIRSAEHSEAVTVLRKLQKEYSGLSNERLKEIARAFSLMLELINRCESAYRYTRLQGRERKKFKIKPHAIIFVFTAHPTEARSPEMLYIFQEIYHLLIETLNKGVDHTEERLRFFIDLAINTPMSRSAKPTVEDEARYLYSFVLRDEIVAQQIRLAKDGINVNFRSWVGGDKDGHPGVNEKTMLMSWTLSRGKLLDWIQARLARVEGQLELLGGRKSEGEIIRKLVKSSEKLRKLGPGDGSKVVEFKQLCQKLAKSLEKTKISFPDIEDISTLLWTYPAIVLPLEIREDAGLVREALQNDKQAIAKMLAKLASVSAGYKPKWYVRGFILSMSESVEDIEAGVQLQRIALGDYRIPVVALFETAQALENSDKILDAYFERNPKVVSHHQKEKGGRFEVMLGYSDSSKESGVLPSRYLISRALFKMDKLLVKRKLVPVFFHGSGGSIERGGGSIREQTEWWPESAVRVFKATTQGEMIARNFQSDMIMNSQVEKIVEQLNFHAKRSPVASRALEKLCSGVRRSYSELIGSETFREDILAATPYQYLDLLKIGSRPSKRQSVNAKLRAIPWVLCWTQTRLLMPTWWGVGSAFEAMAPNEKDELKALFESSKLLSSYFKNLGFTLRKVELPIFEMYLQAIHDRKKAGAILKMFEEEYRKAMNCFHWVTGESELLWFRPWLSQSIYYRSSMVHPLNLIQLEALKRKDEELLGETVTGVACGMLTTG